MTASMRVILSARVAWAAVNEAAVVENVMTAAIIVRKSLVEMAMYCCCGGAEVLGLAIFE